MTERTTVRLAEDLLTRAKRKAAEEGRTLTSLIEEGLRAVIAGKRDGGKAKRIVPRISTAGGGFAADLASLQDDEDLDYARRLQRL